MKINSIRTGAVNFKQNKTAQNQNKLLFVKENKKTLAYSTVGVVAISLLTFLITKKIKSFKHEKAVKLIANKINEQFNLVEKTKGLNKIKGNEKLTAEIKETILKPYVMEKIGMDIASTNSLPNGMVIHSKGSQTGQEVVEAFMEHVKEMGYKTVKIDNSAAQHQDDFSKNIGYTIKKLQEDFEKTKEYTFVDIGCLDDFAHSRRAEPEYLTSVGSLLKPFENSSQKGVFWTGWTKNAEVLDDALLDRGYLYNAL